MCALKVSLSTAKGKCMPVSGRLSQLTRLLRLMAAVSLIIALAGVFTILNGESAARSQALIAAAIVLGSLALLGSALLALPFAHRKKDKNDPRS
jgi:hypothetical protein